MTIKSCLSPEFWDAVPRNPRLQDNQVLQWRRFEKGKYPQPKNFEVNDYSRNLYDSPSQNDNTLRHFEGVPANYELARRFCAKYNNVIRNPKGLRQLKVSQMDYLLSLENFNLCFACDRPIKTRKETITRPSKYGSQTQTLEYADILEHNHVYQDEKGKMRFELVPKTRVFAEKCNCGMTLVRKRAKMEANYEKSLDYWER